MFRSISDTQPSPLHLDLLLGVTEDTHVSNAHQVGPHQVGPAETKHALGVSEVPLFPRSGESALSFYVREAIPAVRAALSGALTKAEVDQIRFQFLIRILIWVTDKPSELIRISDQSIVDPVLDILFDRPAQTRTAMAELPGNIEPVPNNKQSVTTLAFGDGSTLYVLNSGDDNNRIVGSGGHSKQIKPAHYHDDSSASVLKKFEIESLIDVLSAFKETWTLDQLTGVPGILHPKHVFAYENKPLADQPYVLKPALSMERLRGISDGRIKRGFHLTQFKSLAETLSQMHQRGFVHNDLKHHNILLRGSGKDETLVLIDLSNTFKIECMSNLLVFPHMFGGSMFPPEVGRIRWLRSIDKVQTRIKDPTKIDSWAFGVLLVDLLFPHIHSFHSFLNVFKADREKRFEENHSSLVLDYRAHVLGELNKVLKGNELAVRIIQGCLTENPDDRCSMPQIVDLISQAE